MKGKMPCETLRNWKKANRLTGNLIRPGQELIIPEKKPSASEIVDNVLSTTVVAFRKDRCCRPPLSC
jgi:LysM repeat protein